MSKIILIAAIFLLLLSAFSMIISHQGFAQKILTLFFWVFLAGCVAYFFEAYEK